MLNDNWAPIVPIKKNVRRVLDASKFPKAVVLAEDVLIDVAVGAHQFNACLADHGCPLDPTMYYWGMINTTDFLIYEEGSNYVET